MPFHQVRQRLIIVYSIVFIAILSTFALGVRLIFSHKLHQQLSLSLSEIGESAIANTNIPSVNASTQTTHDPLVNTTAQFLHLAELNRYQQSIQWFDTQGKLIRQQGELQFNLSLLHHDRAIQYQTQPKAQAITLAIVRPPSPQVLGYVRVQQSLDDTDHALQQLDWGLAGGVILALVVTGIGGMILTRQAMQPIAANFQRLKQFTADASHELRSPLTAIKSNTAVALKYDEGMREGDRQKFQAILSATQQLTSLTEDLLLLARSDSTQPPIQQQTVDLSDLLTNLSQRYAALAYSKNIQFTSEITAKLQLLGDPAQVTRLFSNILDNAFIYTQASGQVTLFATKICNLQPLQPTFRR